MYVYIYTHTYTYNLYALFCRKSANRFHRGVELEGKIITVTLGNNRFCWCKGASHRSNHVYLVADLLRGDFYQILCLENWEK